MEWGKFVENRALLLPISYFPIRFQRTKTFFFPFQLFLRQINKRKFTSVCGFWIFRFWKNFSQIYFDIFRKHKLFLNIFSLIKLENFTYKKCVRRKFVDVDFSFVGSLSLSLSLSFLRSFPFCFAC